MRVPGFLLDKSVQVELPSGSSPSGQTFGDAFPFACHFEDRTALKVDMRTDSDTAGTEIAMTGQVIGQLDRRIEAGARVTFPDGTVRIAGNVRHFEHRYAPSNTELWGAN